MPGGRGERVLHTWGSAMTHHPHVHMIVPGGGLSPDGARWIAARPNFFLPVLVLSKLFRRLMLEKLAAAHKAGKLTFFGAHAHLADDKVFAGFLAPLRKTRWFVYSKRPFAGPKAVLAYLSRYTHRVAISNSRLIAADAETVTFKVKDYRVEGPGRYTTMTLGTHEFIRRFLLHVLPKVLPSHPPLRPPRRQRARRAPGAGSRASASPRHRHWSRARGCRPSSNRVRARNLMPLLRRPHDRHRDVRGRLPAQARADHQDRHVMTVPPCICRRTEHRCRRSLAGRGGARLPPHAPQQIEPRSPAHRTGQCSLARRPHPIASPACSARRRSPQSSNPSATAKSP